MRATCRSCVLLFGVLGCLLAAQPVRAWGANGHRITAEIAESRLTPATRAALDEIIGTRKLAQVANWADFVKAESAWDFARHWHYVTVEDERRLAGVLERADETMAPDNVVEGVEFLSGVLRSDEAKTEHLTALLEQEGAGALDGSIDATAVAFIVHLVGDLHQPLHVGRGGDRGGNQITVNWFGEQMRLHAVWDSGLIDQESLSYTEFTAFIEQEFEDRAVDWSGGGTADWAAESRELRHDVYEIWDSTDRTNHLPNLGWQYSHDHIGTVKQRLFQGGVRLATLLNSIFD